MPINFFSEVFTAVVAVVISAPLYYVIYAQAMWYIRLIVVTVSRSNYVGTPGCWMLVHRRLTLGRMSPVTVYIPGLKRDVVKQRFLSKA